MGSGKTKTGQLLSRKLSYEFIDTDNLIESSEQKSVTEIFKDEGEAAFREIERGILEETSHKTNCVISTGGGLPCFFDNMELMNKSGMTVYLKVPPNMLVSRLLDDKNKRPLLMDLDESQLRTKVQEQLQEREFYYEQAQLIYPAASLDASRLAEEILKFYAK